MIVRDGRRNESANTPAPGHVAGIYAINTIAVAPETHVAPVERRYLSREELARIHEDDGLLEPQPVVVTVRDQSDAIAKARSRGGLATKRNRAESLALARAVAWQGRTHNTKVTADAILDALRLTQGNQSLAADLVGLTRPALRERVRTMLRRETLPADIAATLRTRGGWRKAA